MGGARRHGPTAVVARAAVSVAGAAVIVWAVTADAHWAERHVLPSYCATGPAGWVVARAVRWVAAALGIAAVVSLAPALARFAERAPWRVRAGSIAGVAVALAASLGVTELYLRRLHDRVVLGEGRSRAAGEGMTQADRRLGWSYLPDRTTSAEVGGRRVSYAIDAEGDRASSTDGVPDRDRPTVVFAGESIAFGYGLEYEETFPFLVGRDLGVQSVNVAVIGYGNDQAHLRALDALSRYRHPMALVTVFVPSQIRRNVDVWRPRLALGPDGALELVPPSNGPRIAKLLQELPYRGDEPLRVTAAILRATADAARARGAFPLFVVTNYGPACLRDGGDEAWVVEELFARQGLAFVRVDLGPEDRLPGVLERHPNARGARKIAAAVERALSGRLTTPAAAQ